MLAHSTTLALLDRKWHRVLINDLGKSKDFRVGLALNLVVCSPLGILKIYQLLIESARALEIVSTPSLPDHLANLDNLSSALDPTGQGIRPPLRLNG